MQAASDKLSQRLPVETQQEKSQSKRATRYNQRRS